MIEKLLNERLLRSTIIIILLFILYFSLKKILHKILTYQSKKTNIDIKKFNTVWVLFTNLIKYVLILIGILVLLNAFGFKVSSVVTGLGIFSAVLVLSLQDLLKDFFAGIFILLENQFSIGDIIQTNNFKGEVIFLGLKSTKIRNYNGEIKILSNRNIVDVTNYSNTRKILIDINIAYEEDSDKVLSILNKLCLKLNQEIDNIIGQTELLGIVKLNDSSVIYRIVADAEYSHSFEIERQLLKEIKDELQKHNIKIPYPQLEVHHGK